MIREIADFVAAIPEIKSQEVKPKEGLHILLAIQKDGERLYIDDGSLKHACLTRKKDKTAADIAFLKDCAMRSRLSWCVNTNKCFDLPVKAIHSCSPYCIALKRENLAGGEKYGRNAKAQVYERISSYFGNAMELLDDETEKQRVRLFENTLNTEEKFEHWLGLVPEYGELKDKDYIIFYLDEPLAQYEAVNSVYLADKLFNTNEHNTPIGEVTFGTSDFFNGYPTKKPFLRHQSAYFDIAGRISADDARSLYDFQEILGKKLLPNPVPVFIHAEELTAGNRNKTVQQAAVKCLSNQGRRITYREVMEELYGKAKSNIGNYYLLFSDPLGAIVDFDFVPKFEYELKTEDGEPWIIDSLFNDDPKRQLDHVFRLEMEVLQPVFNNALITQTKSGNIQSKYFDEIDAAYVSSAAMYLLVQQYRKAFYDFIYKSARQSITQSMFDHILQVSIIEDMRIDQVKKHYFTRVSILKKMNIWFSLSDNLNQKKQNNYTTMASRLQSHREFMNQLAEGKVNIEQEEQYAFAVGQILTYLLSKSMTADRSYKRLEPFLQQVSSSELNKAIARMFDMYKHAQFSVRFRNPFAQVMDYETGKNMREYIPTILAGIFSYNELFSSADRKELKENGNDETDGDTDSE